MAILAADKGTYRRVGVSAGGEAPPSFFSVASPTPIRRHAPTPTRSMIGQFGWVDDVVLVVSILKFDPLCVVPFTG
jgi:hypothetical protein